MTLCNSWPPQGHQIQCPMASSTVYSLVFTSDISIRKITKSNYPSEVYEDKAGRIFFCSAVAYGHSIVLILMLMSMVMSIAHFIAFHFFVLSFVLAYAYVASENHAGVYDGQH